MSSFYLEVADERSDTRIERLENMKPLLVIGAGGLLLWYLNSKGYLSSVFGSTSTTTTTTTTPPAGTTATNTNSLAAIFTRLQADAGSQAAQTGLSAYGWNYSLARVTTITPPDPQSLWATAGLDPTQNMTANQYWAIMAPALTTQFGLSGFRGMGRMNYHRGWAV